MGNEYTLPRKLALDNIMDLLDQVKRHPRQEESKLSKLVTEFSRGKSSLLEWKLIESESGCLRLSDLGTQMAYASEQDKQEIILNQILVSYEPYYIFITHLVKDWKEVVTTEDASRIFATKARITLSHEHLNAACAMTFAVMEAAGLGTYKRGRNGQMTRIEFRENAHQRLKDAMDRHSANPPSSPDTGGVPDATQEDAGVPVDDPPSLHSPEVQIRSIPPAVPIAMSSSMPSGPVQMANSVFQATTEADSEWIHLPNPLFDLRIKKSSQAWDAIEKLIPIYRELFIDAND